MFQQTVRSVERASKLYYRAERDWYEVARRNPDRLTRPVGQRLAADMPETLVGLRTSCRPRLSG